MNLLLPMHIVLSALFVVAGSALAAAEYSAPAIPLAARSPFFQVWTFGRKTPSEIQKHWSFNPGNGFLARTVAMARVGEQTFNLIADPVGGLEDAQQSGVVVGATRTELKYALGSTGIQIVATFTSPLIPDDMYAFADPVVYVNFYATSNGHEPYTVDVLFGVTGELLVSYPSPESGVSPGPHASGAESSWCNDTDWDVSFMESKVPSAAWTSLSTTSSKSGTSAAQINGSATLRAARIGKARQQPLCNYGDMYKGNWGWQYLVPVPRSLGGGTDDVTICTGCGLRTAARAFAATGNAGNSVDAENPRPFNEGLDREPAVMLSARLGMVAPGAPPSTFALAWAVDELESIRFFNRTLVPLWRRAMPPKDYYSVPQQMLARAASRFQELDELTKSWDAAVLANATAVGGPSLGFMASMAYRQALGAGAITWEQSTSTLRAFVKEQSTNGDLSTQDIIWPQMPILLLYAPWLLLLEEVGHLELADNRTNVQYPLEWTPHQLGRWPIAQQQEQEYMPVETTADFIFSMVEAERRSPGLITEYLTYHKYWDAIGRFANFLAASLPDPPVQKYTNDFRGNYAGWTNLAVKGTIGLSAYAWLIRRAPAAARASLPDPDKLAAAAKASSEFFNDKAWVGPDHFRTCYDCEQYNGSDTFDYKYNLMGRVLLDGEPTEGLAFDTAKLDADLKFYQGKMQRFGVPFASNDNVTGVPTWQMMFGVSTMNATTGEVGPFFQALLKAGARAYSNDSVSPVPMSDMFDCVTLANKGHNGYGMRARPTVGTVFLPIYVSMRAKEQLWPVPYPELPTPDTY